VSVSPDHLLKFSLVSAHDIEGEDNSEEKGERNRFSRSYGLVLGRVTMDSVFKVI